jgi:predicted metal-dependent HD superfamily phosphohydrolase
VIGALGERWTALLTEAGADAERGADAYRHLIHRYQEPWRRYHTLEHVVDVLDAIDELEAHVRDRAAVSLAAWYHDAVYRPHSVADDEADSAIVAREHLESMGVAPVLVAEVARLVELTRHHDPQPGDDDGSVLCDADLAILGAGRWQYARYADGVRYEYRHLADRDFRTGRETVLQRFIARPRIYATERFHHDLDGRARANIRWELGRLASGLVERPADLGGPLSRPV